MNRIAMIVRRSNSWDAALGASSVALWSGRSSGWGSGARMTASSASGEDDVQDDDDGDHDPAEDVGRLPPGVTRTWFDARPGVLVGQRPGQAHQLRVRLRCGDHR